jgi:glyoxylase-like metal-dependent hydrolase (beta-lactamase superfamily II)
MDMKQISDHCFAVLNEKNPACDANSGLISIGGGVVIDTQSDLAHAHSMIEMFGRVWTGMPRRVINTHEDADHVSGNQLFREAEIIAHRSVPARMKHVADAKESQTLLVLPTTLFETRYELDLDGTEVHLIYVGPCHQVGDTIVHVPKERVVFAGDVVFRQCTPIGWTGTYDKWFTCLDLILELDPEVIVPGHGPLCGIEGACEMRAYLEYVRDESRTCFEAGLTSLDAAKRIELGPYREWRAPARLFMNVERAYRELQNKPFDAHWDTVATLEAICEVATARGIPIEF